MSTVLRRAVGLSDESQRLDGPILLEPHYAFHTAHGQKAACNSVNFGME